eukprot:CAMPEP_0117622596 /NCGR_PEP_ID=MMETSP0784-20121206/88221_1 /TAXON_ID=39447 /ORGANISM="" /LENGTH=117 /DNA_ID=CAMNT_0005426537 /DNA_START=159 /DNA_END=513 /DNA_ORIENTATION=-
MASRSLAFACPSELCTSRRQETRRCRRPAAPGLPRADWSNSTAGGGTPRQRGVDLHGLDPKAGGDRIALPVGHARNVLQQEGHLHPEGHQVVHDAHELKEELGLLAGEAPGIWAPPA